MKLPNRFHKIVWAGCLLVIVVAPGCGEAPTMGEVSGTVTVDGQPAETGAISFFPVDGRSPTAGGEIVNGQYTAQVPFGVAKVEIRVPIVVGQKKLYDTPNSPVQPLMEEVLPPKYNDKTELTFDVQPGENAKDYELTTE